MYYLYKDVEPEAELLGIILLYVLQKYYVINMFLVYYGDGFARNVGIEFLSQPEQSGFLFAPKRAKIECSTCVNFSIN